MCHQCQALWLNPRPQKYQTAELKSNLMRVRDCSSSTSEWNYERQRLYLSYSHLCFMQHSAILQLQQTIWYFVMEAEEGIWWEERHRVRPKQKAADLLLAEQVQMESADCFLHFLDWILGRNGGTDLKDVKLICLSFFLQKNNKTYKVLLNKIQGPGDVLNDVLTVWMLWKFVELPAGAGSMWARQCLCIMLPFELVSEHLSMHYYVMSRTNSGKL